jgi:hypothetical protein
MLWHARARIEVRANPEYRLHNSPGGFWHALDPSPTDPPIADRGLVVPTTPPPAAKKRLGALTPVFIPGTCRAALNGANDQYPTHGRKRDMPACFGYCTAPFG